jgi:ketosteroid isomerase-like protein
MPDRDAVLKMLDEAYAAREAGDKARMRDYFSPGATMRIAGDEASLPGVNLGPAEAVAAVEALIDGFKFDNAKRVDAVVEGDRAAVIWRMTVTGPNGKAAPMEICDFWTIGKDGKLAGLVQFCDTAMVATMIR